MVLSKESTQLRLYTALETLRCLIYLGSTKFNEFLKSCASTASSVSAIMAALSQRPVAANYEHPV